MRLPYNCSRHPIRFDMAILSTVSRNRHGPGFLERKAISRARIRPTADDDRKSLVAISRTRQVLDVSTVLMPPQNCLFLSRDLSGELVRHSGRARGVAVR